MVALDRKPFSRVLPFEDEQHGCRAENIKRSLDAELYFYGQILAFGSRDSITPVPIKHWSAMNA